MTVAKINFRKATLAGVGLPLFRELAALAKTAANGDSLLPTQSIFMF
jgi:hypothetical protein